MPQLESLEDRYLLSAGYTVVNLASDVPGLAPVTDPNLSNPWGLAYSPTGPFWFADNNTGVADALDGRGRPIAFLATVPSASQSPGSPSGVVFNSGSGFVISEHGVSQPSLFLFATEDGTISGWSEVLDPSNAVMAVNNSSTGADYKGLALGTDASGQTLLYAADFGRGTIDVFNQNFQPVNLPGAFQDPNLPAGYAPFNIQNIGNELIVTYAQQDAAHYDAVPGAGNGFIDVYNTDGALLSRFASQGALNAPWGLAVAPADWGPLGGALLVGNNGDGHINAYAPGTGAYLGTVTDGNGNPITIPSLWGLTFGNGHVGGNADTLFFSAGVDDQLHGLFGAIQSPEMSGADTAGALPFDPNAPGEGKNYPLPPVNGPGLQGGADRTVPTVVLLPLAESSLAQVPTLSSLARPDTPVEIPIQTLPGAAGALDRSTAVGLLAASTPLPLPGANSPAPQGAPSPITINSFLDLTVVQQGSQGQAGEQQADSSQGVLLSDSSPSEGSDASAQQRLVSVQVEQLQEQSGQLQVLESSQSVGAATTTVSQLASEGCTELADGGVADNDDLRGPDPVSWITRLTSLLSVVSIVGVLTCVRRRRGTASQNDSELTVLQVTRRVSKES